MILLTVVVFAGLVSAKAQQAEPAPAQQTATMKGNISGHVMSGKVPLPGVSVTAANSITGRKYTTSTDVDGSYNLPLPAFGRYVVRAELSGFAASTKEVVVNATSTSPSADLDLVLQSRVQTSDDSGSNASAAAAQSGRGIRNLGGTANDTAGATTSASNSDNSTMTTPGVNADLSSESVSIAGNMGQTAPNVDELRNRVEDMRDGRTFEGGPGGPPGTFGLGGEGGPTIINIGGPGGFGGRAGRGGMHGFRFNQPHGTIYYQFGDSALNAAPYSLTGTPSAKPAYQQNRFGALLGGPLNIPHIYNGGMNTFFFFNWTGGRNTNPFDAFSIVPTAAERAGDFAGLTDQRGRPITIIDPTTGQPFPGNVIPTNHLNPTALALLNFYPLPNQSGTLQNFHGVYSGSNDTDQVNARLIHNFGGSSGTTGGPGTMIMTPFGGMNNSGGKLHQNINFGIAFQRGNSDVLNVYPQLGGKTDTHNLNLSGGYTLSYGRLNASLRVGLNQAHTQTFNRFANKNIEQMLGITGVSTNPADSGLPRLTFSDIGSLSDVAPANSNTKSFSIDPTLRWRRGKHNLTFGADYHRNFLALDTAGNARGTFVFSGFSSGYDVADFLLGLPQQTSVQTIQGGAYHFRANNYSLYAQDDWRVLGNLSLNVGLRYEYAGPYCEQNNRLVNLVPTADFTGVSVIQAGQPGYSASLVRPDRNNWAPRLGIAWKPLKKTVVRAGYGINYNLGQYGSIAQQLALQPPFAFTQTNIASSTTPLTLQNGFPQSVGTGLITNNYAVNPNYRVGYVQNWNLDIQRELPGSVVMNLTYQAAKGTRLDVQTAPNRTPTGLLIPNVESFLFEDSLADSIYHAGSLRIRKRLKNGFSVGGTYTYSKSIDDASSIGGGSAVVAQDPRNISAERGLSSFDQRHRFVADFYYELPFGSDKPLLHGNSWFDHILSNTQWNGNVTLGSGNPFTARFLNNVRDVATGVTGTLRPDLTGQSISGPQTIGEWFNTAAFSAVAPAGYGDAPRNNIIGPGLFDLDMGFSKSIQFEGVRRLEFRWTATNILNHPHFTSIDTIVNSPTFGEITNVGAMRSITFQTRFNF